MAPLALPVDLASPRGWEAALAPARAEARALLAAFGAQAEAAARAALGPLGPAALAAVRAALAAVHRARGAVRGAELAAVAAALGAGRAEVLLANLAYDLAAVAPLGRLEGPGCTTFVRDGAAPLHARNLDWRFPGDLLRAHLRVLRVRGGRAGPYAMVGWPGLVGALTAVAPGRFSVSVNFVRARGEAPPRLLARLAAGARPVPFAVRDALDGARTYAEAVALLASTPLLAPAILAIAGTRRGEACVVERTARGAAVRGPERGAVCATNHFVAPGLAGRSVDYDAGSSFERLAGLSPRAARDVRGALGALAPAVRDLTQHQVVMRARDGLLVVRVPGQRPRRVAV